MTKSIYGRADLHMHTSASDGASSVAELLNYVNQYTRLDVIAITDHDKLDASLWAYEHADRYPFDIIPGVEVTSCDGHVLGLWVTKPIPRLMSLEDTVQAIHEQNGLAILAHPYHFQVSAVARSWWQYTRYPERLLEINLDGLEVHNAGILVPGENMLARCLGHYLKIAVTGSSDAHTLGAIGSGTTIFSGRSAGDLRQALINNKTIAEGRAWPLIDYWRYLRISTHDTSSEFLAENLP
ncbi:MAG: PHP domain-containing protein [Aggregatilineales bacterium]